MLRQSCDRRWLEQCRAVLEAAQNAFRLLHRIQRQIEFGCTMLTWIWLEMQAFHLEFLLLKGFEFEHGVK